MQVSCEIGGARSTLTGPSRCLFLRHHKHRAGPPHISLRLHSVPAQRLRVPRKNVREEAFQNSEKQTHRGSKQAITDVSA
jgi:hypothetical protein